MVDVAVLSALNGHHAAPASVAGKAIAICGSSNRTRDEILALNDDPAVAVWGLNSSYTWMPRRDRWFEMHARNGAHFHFTPDHLAALAAMPCPILMDRHYDDLPMSVAFPFDAVQAMLGPNVRPIYSSSIDYMLALAVLEKTPEIRLLGVDMALDGEFAFERPGCDYWRGVAESRGITVTIPPASPLAMLGPRYGVESRDALRVIGQKLNSCHLQSQSERDKFLAKIDDAVRDARAVSMLMQAARTGGPVLGVTLKVDINQAIDAMGSVVDTIAKALSDYEDADSILNGYKQALMQTSDSLQKAAQGAEKP